MCTEETHLRAPRSTLRNIASRRTDCSPDAKHGRNPGLYSVAAARWNRIKDSVVFRAGRRPLAGTERLLRVARAIMTLAAVIASVWAAVARQYLWLALLPMLVGAYGWVAAFKAEAQIKAKEIAKGSFALDWQKVAAEKTSEDNWFPDYPQADSYLISFVAHNKGAPFELKVTLASRTVRGVDREFPQGDRALRWLNVRVPALLVESDGQPRVDVAVVAPSVNAVRFLGPTPSAWQPLTKRQALT